MNDTETKLAVAKKVMITLWPTILMMSIIFENWLYLYDGLAVFLTGLMINAMAVIFIGYSIYLFMRRKPKRAMCFLIPVLIAALLGTLLISPLREITMPLRRIYHHSHHYVEFLKYDKKYNIRKYVAENKPDYKEWSLVNRGIFMRSIVYDKNDELIKKDSTEDNICHYSVFRLGEHFYMFETFC